MKSIDKSVQCDRQSILFSLFKPFHLNLSAKPLNHKNLFENQPVAFRITFIPKHIFVSLSFPFHVLVNQAKIDYDHKFIEQIYTTERDNRNEKKNIFKTKLSYQLRLTTYVNKLAPWH